ncbi:hypothetical protein [Bradyrhizobium sp. CCBAU 051011]|uniref:hypothetical protein n=1 Tax=Bradyrhizobium sp. CCBAU 051011 TaxID=858422 RepID=UPI001FEDD6F7|nr:hypothetical protein [Bradyrhizobium sp. CCBAU 051011]
MDGIYPLPQVSHPNRDYIVDQKTMLNMSSFWNITAQNSDAYVRGVCFSEGHGRAFVGFTETMSKMTPNALATIGFKIMPLSNTTTNRPLFYVDAVGVNTTTVQRGTRNLALQLANVIAATDTDFHLLQTHDPLHRVGKTRLCIDRSACLDQIVRDHALVAHQEFETSLDPLPRRLGGGLVGQRLQTRHH